MPTWSIIVGQLASAVIQKIGALAVQGFLEELLGHQTTLTDLLDAFEREIREVVRGIENYLDNTWLDHSVIAVMDSVAEQFPVFQDDPIQLKTLWSQISLARGNAGVINRKPANRLNPSAFGAYFLVIDFEVAISEQLANLYLNDPKQPDEDLFRRWRLASRRTIALGFAYLQAIVYDVHLINTKRVSVRPAEINPSSINPDMWIVILDDKEHKTTYGGRIKAQEAMNDLIVQLDSQYETALFSPVKQNLSALNNALPDTIRIPIPDLNPPIAGWHFANPPFPLPNLDQ